MTLEAGIRPVVALSGAGGSLGRDLARAFGRAGYAIGGIDVSADALVRFDATMRDAGIEALSCLCDIRDWSASARAVARIAATLGGVDVLVNNATARTTPVFKRLVDCSYQEMRDLSDVGPHAALGLMQAALPFLKRKPGTVINIGSGAGVTPPKGSGPYGMAKAALHLLTQSGAREWAEYGITVNGILPLVMTEKLAEMKDRDPNRFNAILPPLGRAGDGETDIGAVALFLVSPAASYITGQNIPVDGGGCMMR